MYVGTATIATRYCKCWLLCCGQRGVCGYSRGGRTYNISGGPTFRVFVEHDSLRGKKFFFGFGDGIIEC